MSGSFPSRPYAVLIQERQWKSFPLPTTWYPLARKCSGMDTAFSKMGDFRQCWRLKYMPDVEGRIPVKTLVREGLHAGAAQWALVKSTPLFASLSRFGVCTPGRPPKQLAQSFRSSTAIKRMFGGGFLSEQDVIQGGRAIAAAPRPMVLMKSRRDLFMMYPNGHLASSTVSPGVIGDGCERTFIGKVSFDDRQAPQ